MSSSDDRWEKRANRHYDYFSLHPFRYVGAWIAGLGVLVVILLVVGNALGIANVFWNAERAKITNPARVQQKVYQPENTIAQVAFFHNTCRDVVAQFHQWQNIDGQLQVDQQILRSTKDPLQQQQAIQAVTQDENNLTGAANQIQTSAQDYNSRSAQYTANAFKDAGLPDRIEPPSGASLKTWSPPNCG